MIKRTRFSVADNFGVVLDIHWFTSREGLEAHRCAVMEQHGLRVEQWIKGAGDVAGYCTNCDLPTRFLVDTGAKFADRPNLREGMRCVRCKLTARQRLVQLAFANSAPEAGWHSTRGAILERHSRLFRGLRRHAPKIIGSEFLGATAKSGRHYWRTYSRRFPVPRLTRHESILGFSYPDQSLGFLIHTDILEHVEPTRAAMEECRRVLRPSAPMIFTAPFFCEVEQTLVRGKIDESGQLIELMPAEYHGDGVGKTGIYTFYNFGWSLFELLQSVFNRVEIGMAYGADEGFLYADSEDVWSNMPPLVFRCYP